MTGAVGSVAAGLAVALATWAAVHVGWWLGERVGRLRDWRDRAIATIAILTGLWGMVWAVARWGP